MYIAEIKNLTASDVEIADLGIVVPASGTSDATGFDQSTLRSSTDIITVLNNGDCGIICSDGVELTNGAAIDKVRGGIGTIEKEGALKVLVSDKPADHTWMLVGGGDDVTEPVHYFDGEPLEFDVAPGQTQVRDFKFLDDIYIRGGILNYQSAAFGSTFDVEVVAPLGTPYPSYSSTGNLNFDGVSFTPNGDGTGNFNQDLTQDKVFAHFIKHGHLMGDRQLSFTAQESHKVPSIYFVRISVYNASDTDNLQLVMTAEMFRSMISFS